MNEIKKEEVVRFIQVVAEGLYPNASRPAEVDIRETFRDGRIDGRSDGLDIEVDVFDQSPGRMIGKAAQLRYAVSTIIRIGLDPDLDDDVRITIFGDADAERSTPPKETSPDGALINRVVEAASLVCGGSVTSTETTATAVISMMKIREEAADPLKPALNRIVRAIGKTRGFPAMIFISNA
tara:strand:- start:16590 stop:17132 length:543 start_codon:yes stop_codon:yes gene_type:complete